MESIIRYEMDESEIEEFLTHLAVKGKVSASTQNQALAAILFMYRNVLERALNWIEPAVRAKRPERLPVVLTRQEVRVVLGMVKGVPHLVLSLLYGAGLRLMEALCLRIKDLDFERGEILIRDGKGRKDRVTMLPRTSGESIQKHLERVRCIHELDLREQARPRDTSGCAGIGNIRMQIVSGAGSMYSPHRADLRSSRPNRTAASCARNRNSECNEGSGPAVRNCKTRNMSFPAAQLRNAFVGIRLRHSNCLGTPWTQRRQYHRDLYPFSE
jgi:integrase